MSKENRKICIINETRATYGLLYWLMKEIQDDKDLILQIVVTGMHLSPEFGLTYKVIEKDGFQIDEKVEMLLSSDTPVGIGKSMGLATISFAEVLDRLKPDIMLVLGDRYELLAASQAALIARIPIAHLYAGESSEGAVDEAIRHSITKMAHFHFTTHEIYRKRVIQLGENPKRVFNFGSPGLDHLSKLELLSKSELEKSLDFRMGELNFLVTLHPTTLSKEYPGKVTSNLIDALKHFPKAKIIITKSNSDTEGRIINQLFEKFAEERPGNVKIFTSLGQLRYLSTLQHIDAVIGNSSSGIHEVPSFKKPTVNIGDRQRGRLKANSVVDCAENTDSIADAITKVLSEKFQTGLVDTISPYRSNDASHKIKEILKTIDLSKILMKKFYDINFEI